jgi:hypothetical protein
VGHAGFWLLVLALIPAYGTLVLGFFPSTKYTSNQITNWLFYELASLGENGDRLHPEFDPGLDHLPGHFVSLEGESLRF